MVLSAALLLLLLLTGNRAASLTAAPPAQTTTTWRGEYFANRNLQGAPAFTRDDPSIDFAWGAGSPGAGIPSDDFSVRWTRWLFIDPPGNWTFTPITDDGVRLLVDDVLVLDAWSDQPLTARSVALNLGPAFHLVRMEYYEHVGNAEAHLNILPADFPDWRGEYFANPDLVGAPAFVRNDSAINFDFGTAGPGGGVPGTDFSARWTRSQYLNGGRYRFTTTTDDGVRLWVDQQLVIDQWRDQTPKSWSGDVTLTEGAHWLRLEYFQHAGNALARLTWALVPGSTAAWRGEYFDNPGLDGSPAFSRDDSDIHFNWGGDPPGKGIARGTDWSARWTARRAVSTAGFYTLTAIADDGVRVWVDNNLVIDEWHDQEPTPRAATIFLNAGAHDWRVEYYQHVGTASLRVRIPSGVVAPPLASATTGDVILDDGAPGFFKSDAAADWRDFTGGYGGHAYGIRNHAFRLPESNWARWYPTLPQAGFYEVSAYLPANLATTRRASYAIAHAQGYDLQNVNQALYANQWVSLGTYYFDATGGEYVALSDTTYEPALSTVIAVDAVRFSLQ